MNGSWRNEHFTFILIIIVSVIRTGFIVTHAKCNYLINRRIFSADFFCQSTQSMHGDNTRWKCRWKKGNKISALHILSMFSIKNPYDSNLVFTQRDTQKYSKLLKGLDCRKRQTYRSRKDWSVFTDLLKRKVCLWSSSLKKYLSDVHVSLETVYVTSVLSWLYT